MTTYVLAGGCFWCLDAVYRRVKGVSSVVSGYTGGTLDNPDYLSVSSGTTGHAEAVRITFDESVIPGHVILDLFFSIHNPTTLNRQGADVGTQYRSALFYADAQQQRVFVEAFDRASELWDEPLVTTLSPLGVFYEAEPEHQDYFNRNPEAGYCSVVIAPKIVAARQAFQSWLLPE